MRRRLRLGACALASGAAALAVLGCASYETPPEENAKGAVETFLAACAEDDGVPASEALTEATRSAFLTESETIGACKKVLHLSTPHRPTFVEAEAFREAEVSEVHVAGGFGTAAVKVGEHHTEVELEEVGRRWRLSSHPLE